jgi:exodeoxyribonuclease-3
MKVSTWNVNGVRARELEVWDFAQRERPAVLCLQEIKASPADVPRRLVEHEGYWGLWHGHKGYSGVALLLDRVVFPARPAFFHPDYDSENRIVCAQVGDLTLASVYVPNGNKDYPAKVRFLEAMEAWIVTEHQAGRRVVLCGDLNVARAEKDVHPKLRNPNQIGQTPAEQALLERILGHGLVDLLRSFHPDDEELYTWWAPWRNLRERNIGWRLDYVLASPSVAARAVACGAERSFGSSDHGPVTATFEGVHLDAGLPAAAPAPPEPPRSPGQLDLFRR